ncbi:MAG TPA: nodulation protein NfeD [Candidatus Acidoferrales bacterium]
MHSRTWRRSLVRSCVLGTLLFLAATNLGLPAHAAPVASASSQVIQLRIDGEIEPILAEYLVNGIQQANREHAAAIIITIDTPGGLDTSMRQIVQAILQSNVPVVGYVSPNGARAASAGFFILMSTDVAAMSPGTETGAASPIMEVGGQVVQIDPTLKSKIFNDATAFLRSYAGARGRNVQLAETAVTDAKAFSAQEALDGKLVDIVTGSESDLLKQLNGRSYKQLNGSTAQISLSSPVVTQINMTGRETFLSWVVDPDVFFILLIVGVLGLYTEFTHPGIFAPGVIGGICLVLALFAMHLLPINVAGLALIALALALFVLEAKFPTHGILGVGGVISMVLGALILIRTPMTGMGVSLSAALGVAVPFAVIVIILARLVLHSRNWKQTTGREELIGEEGEVTEPAPSAEGFGLIRIHGEIWRVAVLGNQILTKGARVRVKSVRGLTLEVEPVNSAPVVS